MTKRVVLLAALLAMTVVVAAVPALAQEGDGGADRYGAEQYGAGAPEGGGETVTVVLDLAITGEVPGWQTFWADPVLGGQSAEAGFCSTDADFAGGVWPLCEAGVYSAAVEVPAGMPTEIEFVRQDGNSGAVEVFHSEVVTAAEDATVAAGYDFPGGNTEPGSEAGGVFRLVLDGEAPEGYRFWLRDVAGTLGTDPEAPICSTAGEDGMFPECRDGGGANEVSLAWPAGSGGIGFAYEVVMVDAATGEESVVASGSEAMVGGVVIEARHAFADETPQDDAAGEDGAGADAPDANASGADAPDADAPVADAPGLWAPEAIGVSLGGLLGPADGDEARPDRLAVAGGAAAGGTAAGDVVGERVLPATGGAALLVLAVGVLLVGGGLAVRRLVR